MLAALLADPVGAFAQSRLPAGVAADTLVLGAAALAASGGVGGPTLSAGDRIATWVVGKVGVGNPAATGRPVMDVPAGAVVASFGGGPPFAWPAGHAVWTAPRRGRLWFAINAAADHDVGGAARLVVVPLAAPGSPAQAAFPSPAATLERAPGGALVRYTDRAGFGLAPSTLRLEITTSHGVAYDLAAWSDPGAGVAFVPLPPPGISLPPGIHRLRATVEDALGNRGASNEIVFDAGP